MRVPSIFRDCLLAGSVIALCATTSWAVPVKLPLNPVETWGSYFCANPKVATTFFISPCTPISNTSFLRPTAVSRFNITSGPLVQQPNGFVDGEVNDILTSGPSAGSGTCYFDAINFMNNSIGPYRLSETSLVPWANNWDTEGIESGPSYGTLGFDLKRSLPAIPEPSTVLVIGNGLAGLIG